MKVFQGTIKSVIQTSPKRCFESVFAHQSGDGFIKSELKRYFPVYLYNKKKTQSCLYRLSTFPPMEKKSARRVLLCTLELHQCWNQSKKTKSSLIQRRAIIHRLASHASNNNRSARKWRREWWQTETWNGAITAERCPIGWRGGGVGR